ncbi:MAG: GIY-YIG nuclease family protein [bacterium]
MDYNIYFISDGTNIKIGKSKEVDIRKKQLQTANSSSLQVLYIIENTPSTFESFVHKICQDFRITGEWFSKEAIEHLFKHPWYKKHMKPYTASSQTSISSTSSS